MYTLIQGIFGAIAGIVVIAIAFVIGVLRLVLGLCVGLAFMVIGAVTAVCIGVCSAIAYPFVEINKWWNRDKSKADKTDHLPGD